MALFSLSPRSPEEKLFCLAQIIFRSGFFLPLSSEVSEVSSHARPFIILQLSLLQAQIYLFNARQFEFCSVACPLSRPTQNKKKSGSPQYHRFLDHRIPFDIWTRTFECIWIELMKPSAMSYYTYGLCVGHLINFWYSNHNGFDVTHLVRVSLSHVLHVFQLKFCISNWYSDTGIRQDSIAEPVKDSNLVQCVVGTQRFSKLFYGTLNGV